MTTPDTQLIDINSLLAGEVDQWRALLQHSYPRAASDRPKAVELRNLLALIARSRADIDQPLAGSIEALLDPQEGLDPNIYAVLKFADQLFDNYLKNSKIEIAISKPLRQLRHHSTVCMLSNNLPWLVEEDGVQNVLQHIHTHAVGWSTDLGRAGERFQSALVPLIVALTQAHDHDSLVAATSSLQEFFDSQKKRIAKLEKRIRDAEIGSLHTKHAQQLSARTLNQQMAGKKLPAGITGFLQGPWQESMRLLIISDGKDSERWRRIMRLTETLIWTFQPVSQNSPEQQQHIYDSISEISEELRDITVGLHHSSQLDEELSAIENEHLKILKGEPLKYTDFELIDNTNPLVSSQASISKQLLNQVTALQEGQWFFLKAEGKLARIKLTVKIDQVKQLLFTNFLGIKAKQYSFEEFAYLLSSKIIVPISTRDPFKATGEKLLGKLLERYQQQVEKAASDGAIEQEIVRQQMRARDQARRKALKEAEQSAKRQHIEQRQAKKVAEEISRLEQQSQKMQSEQKKPKPTIAAKRPVEKSTEESAGEAFEAVETPATTEPTKTVQTVQTTAADAIDTSGLSIAYRAEDMNVGAKVEFISDSGETVLTKLAAIVQSSGEHVFVDRSGVKQQALVTEALNERLANNSARIIDLGSNFEGTLEKVVNGLRKDRKG